MASRLTIGVTLGDPMGIGPEIIVKALAEPETRAAARHVVFGIDEVLKYAAADADIDPFWVRIPADTPPSAWPDADVIVLDRPEYVFTAADYNRAGKTGGAASFRSVTDAVEAAKAGAVQAVVTAPISKTAWKMAGQDWPGHTELLAKLTGARRFTMLFAGGPLRVALATIHHPLLELRNIFTIGRVFDPIDLCDRALKDWFGIARPRIAVCGLNPHAGENGKFGDDEERVIKPAIAMAAGHGINVAGPFPGDTIFRDALAGKYDLVVAMYHDQGLIPVKLLGMHESVNITLGLPIIRTGPDHGTAYDIAGQNKAHPGSMKASLRMAVELAARKAATATAAAAVGSAAGPKRDG
jgi:4-hydroxythreonine-4-phosphate dehydrogenase